MTATAGRAATTTVTGAGVAARAVDVWKVFGGEGTRVAALAGVSVGFQRGRLTAIMGPSGSGKSTLLHCLAGLDAAVLPAVRAARTDMLRAIAYE